MNPIAQQERRKFLLSDSDSDSEDEEDEVFGGEEEEIILNADGSVRKVSEGQKPLCLIETYD